MAVLNCIWRNQYKTSNTGQHIYFETIISSIHLFDTTHNLGKQSVKNVKQISIHWIWVQWNNYNIGVHCVGLWVWVLLKYFYHNKSGVCVCQKICISFVNNFYHVYCHIINTCVTVFVTSIYVCCERCKLNKLTVDDRYACLLIFQLISILCTMLLSSFTIISILVVKLLINNIKSLMIYYIYFENIAEFYIFKHVICLLCY